ncbi:MAG TPA: aminotransferase class III-fold pyridoxal phosphate-dependent enzyme [Fervidobacterium sp.]|nr:aminotransferase class III-fold pyridoxal phosphate-dependent enzyme [Fervidobacterium sp.]
MIVSLLSKILVRRKEVRRFLSNLQKLESPRRLMMKDKMDRYVHLSNFFVDEDAEVVAERLVRETGRNGRVFFTNSGAESTECALKVVRKVKKSGKIVSFVKNFHGRTMKSLSITGFDDLRRQFVDEKDVVFLPYDAKIVREFFEMESDISAVFLEVLHGSRGLDLIPLEIVDLINHYRTSHNFILVADEVQSGLGRTGKFYAYQYFDLEPNIITVAKGIGGGLPLGACVMLDDLSNAFVTGDHGSTFAPNPVALAAGRAVLSLINNELLEHVREMGEIFKSKFSALGEVRGLGLMRGIKFPDNISMKLTKELFLSQGLLVNVISNGVIRFLLPLNVTIQDMGEVFDRFVHGIESVESEIHQGLKVAN